MGYEIITIAECINRHKDGWSAIIHNGKVIGFFSELKNKSASVKENAPKK